MQDLSGDVLDLGCGTGANLAFYPEIVNRLVLAEPNPHMRHQLALKLVAYPCLPVPDEAFDAVVSKLLLCSVKNPRQNLSEIHRVLRSHGKLLLIEHVIANNRP